MGEEEVKGKRGLPPGGTWVYVKGSRRHAMPEVVDGQTRWKLKDGTDVTNFIGAAPPDRTSGPDGHLHMQVDQPLKVIIVTEEEGLNCLENLFYLSDAMGRIAEELTKIRQIMEADPKVKENLRVAAEMRKAEVMRKGG